jgi:hypothetical protein
VCIYTDILLFSFSVSHMLASADKECTTLIDHDGSANGAAKSPRQLFQERINSILCAPMPRCLQSSFSNDKPIPSRLRETDGSGGTEASSRTCFGASSSLTKPGGRRTPSPEAGLHRSAINTSRSLSAGPCPANSSAVSASPREPIYEQLLRKGRLQQEHREQLRRAAIEREVAELRPAPCIQLAASVLPVAPPRPARRLPPAGERIEDRLLQRAKEKAERERRAAELRRQQSEEDLAAVATFRPHISAHAQATKARYKEPPADRAAWRAKRLEELAQTRHSVEAAELQQGPVINRRSVKLAAEKKAREGLEGLPASEALFLTEHRRRLAQWQAAEAECEERKNASPSITHHAAMMHRAGDVGIRLHAGSYDAAIRRLQREVTWREAHTPFQPEVTTLAAVTAPRYQRDGEEINTQARSASSSAARSRPAASHSHSNTDREAFQPTINPVSAAIAERLPETSMQRLCRPTAVHTLSSYVDPTRSLDTSAVTLDTSLSQRTPRQRTQVRRDITTPRVPIQSPSTAVVSPAQPAPSHPPLPSAVVASLDAYERRRQARLDALRREQSAQELQECTFAPQLNARSVAMVAEAAAHDDGTAGVVERRGLDAVAQRSEAWQQQRERHLETMRQWQAERAAAAEMAERQRGGPPKAGSPLSRTVYGGDGKAWGVDAYLARQQLARKQRQERQERLDGRPGAGVSIDQPKMPTAATATPLHFYRPTCDSTLRSLRPPVSASASARLWTSVDE